MARYLDALRQRAIAAGGQTPVNRVMLDLRDCRIQSPLVINKMAALIKDYAAQIEHYGMLLPKSPLLSLQMKKLMAATPVTYFNSEEEATAWLSS